MSQDLITSYGQDFANELAKLAAVTSAQEKSKLPFLSIQGKKFSVGGDELGNSLNVIVLSTIYDNAYYNTKYDPKNPNPPACFAIGSVQNMLVPSATSPVAQSGRCDSCMQNQWGSADIGKGKACKNGRRLLLASVDDDQDVDLENLVVLRLPPTSLANFSSYSKVITAKVRLPVNAFVTRITFDEDMTYPVLKFSFVSANLPTPVVKSMLSRQEEFTSVISEPYDVSNYVHVEPAQAKVIKKSKMS